ncbi:L,D-transpeptidase family protein [Prosthecobacter sp.]|jgi:lipoprotein-anchoring transpeptidase ErfK/SrfK|uniref:L,D-transpeptidase family protein n=1 Tax=Prosthecobacter sp. TaxID=1965333 RepID=UPI0037836036
MLKRLLFIALLSTAARAQDAGPAKDDPSVPKDRDTVLRIQIFLDRNLFGPGKIDGAIGEFTYKAVVNYNYAHGHRDLYNWAHAQEAAEREVPVPYAAYKIKADLLPFVNPHLPEEPEEQAKFPFMAYRSLAELIAERFHTDESFLGLINPKKNMNTLKPGDIVVVPNVRSFRIEEVKPMQSYKSDPALSSHTIVIDTTERMAAVYSEREMMLAAFPITPGKPQFIPVGQWEVKSIMNTPSFRYDKQFLEEGVRGDEAYQLPPGPNSPVGIIWCGLSKSGIGLHGTALPRTIGRSRSAGCVRFANWDAIRLPQLIRPGSRVIVR